MEVYRPDTDWVDRTLYWRHGRGWDVLAMLGSAAAPKDHPLLTAREIEGWRDAVLAEFQTVHEYPTGVPSVMTLEGVERFIARAAERLNELIPS